jgi:rubrerythrin
VECAFCGGEIPQEYLDNISVSSDSPLDYGIVLLSEAEGMHSRCINELVSRALKTHIIQPGMYGCQQCGLSFTPPFNTVIDENYTCPNCGGIDTWI